MSTLPSHPLLVDASAMTVHSSDTEVAHRLERRNGALIVLTDMRAKGPLSVSACLPHHAHLGVMFTLEGGLCEKRLEQDRARQSKARPYEVNLAPPGTRMWTVSEHIECCRSISLLFDPVTLVGATYGDTTFKLPDEPWLGLQSEPIDRLLRLLAASFEARDELSELYADSLIAAVGVQLRRHFEPRAAAVSAAGLSGTDLKRVLEYIEDNLATAIRLQDLVRLTTLSQSAFCAAFKGSTGLPPHRYHLAARIKRAQASLLAKPDVTLGELAEQLGFADHAHLGRTFRKVVGVAPRAWLLAQRKG